MSKYEEDDINKMFSEIMSSNSIEGLNQPEVQENLNIKDLLLVQESLMDTLMSINSIIYQLYTDDEYVAPEGTHKYVSELYAASEQFFINISKSGAILDDMDLDLLDDDDDDDGESEE